jgi:hypothetical protein
MHRACLGGSAFGAAGGAQYRRQPTDGVAVAAALCRERGRGSVARQVDAGLAAVVIVSLALTLVVGVQAFDALAVHAGGATVLPLERLFESIASDARILVALCIAALDHDLQPSQSRQFRGAGLNLAYCPTS